MGRNRNTTSGDSSPVVQNNTGPVSTGSTTNVVFLMGTGSESIQHQVDTLPLAQRDNIADIVQMALDRRHEQLGPGDGISTRLSHKIIATGAYADEAIVRRYLAGILAASGTDSRNDNGVQFAALIDRLSAGQLLGHYIIYRELRRLALGTSVNLYDSSECRDLAFVIPNPELWAALGNTTPRGNRSIFPSEIMYGLAREGLVDSVFSHPNPSDMFAVDEVDSHPTGLWVRPTPVGAELFLWGTGADTVNAQSLFCPSLRLTLDETIPTCNSAQLVSSLRESPSP